MRISPTQHSAGPANLLSESQLVVVAAAAHFRSRRSSKLRAKMDPPYIQALKGEWGYMKMGFFRDYHAKYMAPGKYRPVVHVIMFVMGLGYLMEYPHLKRARRRSPPPGDTRRKPLCGRHAPRGRASLFFGAIPATYWGCCFLPGVSPHRDRRLVAAATRAALHAGPAFAPPHARTAQRLAPRCFGLKR